MLRNAARDLEDVVGKPLIIRLHNDVINYRVHELVEHKLVVGVI